MGAMQLVANSYEPDELNIAGVSIYVSYCASFERN